MAVRDERQHGMMAAVMDKFPVGMRVLAVDDILKVLEALLHHWEYQATMVSDGEMALRMLHEGREQYDLVISDVHMPGMDGFTLLEIISLDMDIPVIMLSQNGEKKSMMKGIYSGACDYLVKPVKIKELKNIWQHVVRRRIPNPRVQHVEIPESEQGDTKRTGKKKCSRRRINNEVDADENKNNICLSSKKKPRVKWTSELHGKFLQAVNQIGIDGAFPKKIMKMMNVSYITRESVASHLQKFRIYLKKVGGCTGMRRSYSFDNSFKRWNSCHIMNDLGTYNHHYEYGSCSSSGNLFPRINSPSAFGAHGMRLPTQSFYLCKPQSSLGMGPVAPDGSMLKDARKLPPFSYHTNSFANIPGDTMLDDDKDEGDEFPTCYYGNSYTNILHNKLFEARKDIPNNSFKDMPSGTSISVPVKKLSIQPAAMTVPVNQFPIQSSQLGNHHLVHMNCILPVKYFHLQNIVGNCSRSWQTMVPAELPNIGHNGGVSASHGASQADIDKINQLPISTALSGQIPVQDQVAALISNTTPMVCPNEPTMSFGLEANTRSMDMLNGSGISSISSALSGPKIDNFLAPTLMLHGEDAVDGLAILQEDIAGQQCAVDELDNSNQVLGAHLDFSNQVRDDQLNYNNQARDDQLQTLDSQLNLCNQTLDGQQNFNDKALDGEINFNNQAPNGILNYNNDFLTETDELDMSTLDEIIANFKNENFLQDDTCMDGAWN